MVFRLLADAVVVVHLAFVAFVVLGGVLVLRRPRTAWLHLPAVIWAIWVEAAGWICPLTPLENWLRRRGGLDVYASDFVERYLVPLLYPASLTRELQWTLAVAVTLVNTVVYARLLLGRRKPGRP
jgi:hypothetical protein